VKPHKWEKELVDGGAIGVDHFWKCSECGACAGPVWWDVFGRDEKAPRREARIFLADGSGLTLSRCCYKSKRLIAAKRTESDDELA